MRNRIYYKIALLIITLFFVFQLISHIFLSIGETSENQNFVKLSTVFCPIDTYPFYRYGFMKLKSYIKNRNEIDIEESILFFKKSIDRNFLYYMTYQSLGKAYFSKNMPGTDFFERGLEAFKRATFIRKTNIQLNVDTLKLYLSMWPLLKEEDKKFAFNLMGKTIKRVNKNNFLSILEIWRLYSKNADLLKKNLAKRPEFYLYAANNLEKSELFINLRQEFLSNYEVFCLKNTWKEFDKIDRSSIKKLQNLRGVLNSRIKGYYKIIKNSGFKEKNYLELKKELNLNILKILLSKKMWHENSKTISKIETCILSYIQSSSSFSDLEDLNDFLENMKYFEINSLKSFYIKQLINFKLGQFGTMIDNIVNFKQSISYIKKENIRDYCNILLLLSDACISSRLMIQGNLVLKDIEKISPGLIDTYFRKMKIEKIIGPEQNENKEEFIEKTRQYEIIKNSRFINIDKKNVRKVVYFYDENEIIIKFDNSIKDRLKTFHILQVFVNDVITYENYLSQMDESEIKIRIPDSDNDSKYEVEVRIR
jgi:hypothetical protein